MPRRTSTVVLAVLVFTALSCGDTTSTQPEPAPFSLAVTLTGVGTGTVTSVPQGIACGVAGGACEATFEAGTEVTLTASPTAGHDFVAWSGGCSGAAACRVTGNTTVSAEFDDPQTAAQEIGPGGGTVTSVDGRVVLEVPAGALTAAETVSITIVDPSDLDPAFATDTAFTTQLAYELRPDGLQFAEPVRVTVATPDSASVEDTDSLHVAAPVVVLLTMNDNTPVGLDSMQMDVDFDTGMVTVTGLLDHFSPLVTQIGSSYRAARALALTVRGVPFAMRMGETFVASATFWIHRDFEAGGPMFRDESVAPVARMFEPADQPFPNQTDDVTFEGDFTYTCNAADEGEFVARATVNHTPGPLVHLFFENRIRVTVRRSIFCTERPPDPVYLSAFGVDPADIFAGAVSNTGQVAGRVGSTPAVWQIPGEEPTALPEDPSNPRKSGTISAGNDDFTVVGGSYTSNAGDHIAIYQSGNVAWLLDFGPNVRNNTIGGISSDGRFAGGRFVTNSGQSLPWGSFNGTVVDLVLPEGATSGRVYDVNDDGIAVGYYQLAGASHAAAWDIANGGVIFPLPSPGEGSARLFGINNPGMVVGSRIDSDRGLRVGIVWTGTEWIEIPPDETVASQLFLHHIADNGTIACSLEDYSGPIVRHSCLVAVGHAPIVLDVFDGANTLPDGISPNGQFIIGVEYDKKGSFGPAWFLRITSGVCPFCF